MATRTVTVIIGTYNRGERIASTIDSVLSQERPPDELIVVDDGSPDQTGKWVTDHYPADRFPYLRVLRKENGGTSHTRNFGAQAARGDVLIFLDHDDEMLPNAIATLLSLLDEFPEARAAYADHTYNNLVTGVSYPDHHTAQSAFHRLRNVPVLRQSGDSRLYGPALHRAMLWGNLLQQPWAIYRETFMALGGFEATIRYCEDWDMYLRVTAAVPVVLSDRVISHHLVEGENLHLAPGQGQMHVKVIERQLRGRWREPGAFLVLRRRLGAYYKMWGDQADSTADARRWYRRAFAAWPFDHVVGARLLGLDRGWTARSRGVAK